MPNEPIIPPPNDTPELTPIDKPLAEYSKTELFSFANERKIRGRYDMSKDELIAALEEALTAPDEPEPTTDAPEVSEEDPEVLEDLEAKAAEVIESLAPVADTEPPTPPTDEELAAERRALEASLFEAAGRREREREAQERAAEERKAIEAQQALVKREADRAAARAAGIVTDEDRTAIMGATDLQLEELLTEGVEGDEDNPPLPDYLRVVVVAEMDRRRRVREAEAAKLRLTSEVEQYRVTGGTAKGMVYVTPTGYSTTLPVGAIVGPLTHDLEHVKAQGFVWEPLKAVEHSETQLGLPVSFTVGG